MMSKRMSILTVTLLLSVTLLTGCWNRRETADMAIVSAIAMDQLEEGKVLVSLEVLNPMTLAVGVGAGPQDGQPVAWIMTEESTTISNAIGNMARRSPRRIFVGQVSTIVFGQNLARAGIGPYLDYFARQGNFRRTVLINVCDSAAGLLQRPFMKPVPSLALEGLSVTAASSGRSTPIDLNEFLLKMAEPGIEPIAMHTASRETEDLIIKPLGAEVEQDRPSVTREQPLDSDENIPGTLPPDSPVLDPLRQGGTSEPMPGMTILLGISVFRGDQLRGFLDGLDARGYLWAVGRLHEGPVELSKPLEDEGAIVFQIIRVDSSIKPHVEGEQITMKIGIKADFQVEEVTAHDVFLGDPETIRELAENLGRMIAEEIRHSLDIVQKAFQSDIYGFGQALYRKAPKLWQQMEEDWNEGIFPDLPVEIDVTVRIREPGLILRDPGH